jgi:transcriptional regulator with XRE-family HTH domain
VSRAAAADVVPKAGPERLAYLKYQLDLRGKTLADIARAAGADPGYVTRVYNGERENGDKADLVRSTTAKVLGRSVAELFGA